MGGKRGSGTTHIRYGHRTRPTEVLLQCPRCRGIARATQAAWHAGRLSSGDCTPGWSEPWKVLCFSCPFRSKELDWNTMLSLGDLVLRAEVRGAELWAWNRAHLEMLVHVLEGGDPVAHPLGYFATYMHREWLLASRRPAFAKAGRALLARSGGA